MDPVASCPFKNGDRARLRCAPGIEPNDSSVESNPDFTPASGTGASYNQRRTAGPQAGRPPVDPPCLKDFTQVLRRKERPIAKPKVQA